MPLQNLLDWLSQPKCPNLVEASVATVPDRALVLAVTKRMLYGEETPLVGVGLVYKPHYISMEPFSATYMHLHVWHAAGFSVESANKLSSSHLIFVTISKMSDVIPVAAQHPVLLDVATKDTMTRTGEPMAPLSFRGFRLHTVWTRQSGGDLVHQVTFPHLLGEATTSMLEYEQEKFPQGLMQGPKMAINLRPPSSNHWNIILDLILPLTVDTYRQQREAKCVEQDQEGESVGAEVSLEQSPAPRKAPQVVVGGSKAAFPTETTYQGKRALETALDILERIHAIRLQTMHDMGGMRELKQTLVHTLMAEFVRLQLILGEDLTKSLSALCSELETSSEALSSDLLSVLNLHSGDLVFPQVKELIQKRQQSISIKVNLPLMELEAAREDLGEFLQRCLCKLSSHSKSQEMIEELSQTLSTHANRIREAIQVPGIQEPAVLQRVMLGLAVDQPLEAIFFPGILDGLSGRLGLMPPGVVDPPTSAREGMSQQWAAALREAVMRNEGRDVKTMTWISKCGGLMTLLQPSHPLCYQGSSAVFIFLGGQRYPEGLLLPRWKRACGVPAELLLGQMHQAPHTLAGLHLLCERLKWRPKGTSWVSREGSTLTKPSLGLTLRMQLLSSYQMMTRLTSPLIRLRLSPH